MSEVKHLESRGVKFADHLNSQEVRLRPLPEGGFSSLVLDCPKAAVVLSPSKPFLGATHSTSWTHQPLDPSAAEGISGNRLFPTVAPPGFSSGPATSKKGHSVLCGSAHSGGIPSSPQKHYVAQMSMRLEPCSQGPSYEQPEGLPWYLALPCPLQATPPSPVLFHIFLGPSSCRSNMN